MKDQRLQAQDRGWLCYFVAIATVIVIANPALGEFPPYLPVYIEDSHAGSFYWLAQNLDLNEEYTLILFDKHSDASQLFDSDAVRKAIRASASNRTIDSLFSAWRRHGLIQCYNWIEPLMPRPIKRVMWVADDNLSDSQISRCRKEVENEINCHQKAMPRSAADLSALFEVTDFISLPKKITKTEKVIISIDFDYFLGQNKDSLSTRISDVVDFCLTLENNFGITCAISYPYLESNHLANTILYDLLVRLLEIKNLEIYYEPFAGTGPDRSRKGKDFLKTKGAVPIYPLDSISLSLQSVFVNNSNRIYVRQNNDKWLKKNREWDKNLSELYNFAIVVNAKQVLDDERCYVTDKGNIEVRCSVIDPNTTEITWFYEKPDNDEYNLVQKNHGFSDNASRFIRYRNIEIEQVRNKFSFKMGQLKSDSPPQLGAFRLHGVINYYGEDILTRTALISRHSGDNYCGHLTKIFNLPYVFGASMLKAGSFRSAEAMLGADCCSFLIYGLRIMGQPIPYVEPGRFRKYLKQVARVSNGTKFMGCKIKQAQIEKGLFLHFGRHVVAVYQDNNPKNELDGNDLIIHQLEGYPEIIRLNDLRQFGQPFDVLVVKN